MEPVNGIKLEERYVFKFVQCVIISLSATISNPQFLTCVLIICRVAFDRKKNYSVFFGFKVRYMMLA